VKRGKVVRESDLNKEEKKKLVANQQVKNRRELENYLNEF
jgi:hypothetical protein